MWSGTINNLGMTEGDYGVALTVTISGATLGEHDSLRFTFKKTRNAAEVILTKEYASITQNTVELSFTEAESALFHPGGYVFALDWYQDGSFMCNLVENGSLRVGDKA